ncbi:MAG: hypothetical protein AAF672_12830 [Pseudomonadota bacterium]
MTPSEINKYRHRKERSRYILTYFVMVPFLILLLVITFATAGTGLLGLLIFYGIFRILLWFVHSMSMALIRNNMIEVTETSFPEAYAAIHEARGFFGYDKPVVGYVYQDGTYDALIAPLMRTKVLLLNSEVMDADNGQNKEMRFLIGRFVGALAARHYRFMMLEIIIDGFEKIAIFNILLYPYQRATQLTGDRLGYAFIGHDIQTSVRTLLRLSAGKSVAHRVNVNSFLTQGRTSAGFFAFLTRMLSKFPHMTERVNSLVSFSRR